MIPLDRGPYLSALETHAGHYKALYKFTFFTFTFYNNGDQNDDSDFTKMFGNDSRSRTYTRCRMVQESYALVTKHELVVSRDETEHCDTLRYTWHKLQQQASAVSSQLIQVQPTFRRQLVANVRHFAADCNQFYAAYRQVSLYFWLSV